MRSLVEQSFVDRIPALREKHRALGLTEEESLATLEELPRKMREGFDDTEWLELVWAGKLAELGRLQFEDRGDGVLGVHVPETGPLDPAACDASFARAREVYPEHHTFVCTSWLLDPALADVLPADSNIVRFQRRFELTSEGGDANADVLRFVFHTRDPDLDKLAPHTTLERALVERMRAGGRWRAPTGRLSR